MDISAHLDLEPEQICKITSLLKKIEKERTSLDFRIAENVVSNLNQVFKKCLMEGYKAKLYGSYYSQLAVSTSNVNIELVVKGKGMNVNNRSLNELHKRLYKELPDYHISFEEKLHSKKSKICLTEPVNGVMCELMFLGSSTSRKISRLLKALCIFDSRVRTLIIALRVWAEVCEIHEFENGWLHPMGYTFMVIYFLQQHVPPLLPIIDITKEDLEEVAKSTETVGELWVSLLKYYSYVFNWRESVISLTQARPVSKKSRQWETSWIAIEDPFKAKQNIGKTVTNDDHSNHIQTCFQRSFQYFSNPVTDASFDSSESEDNSSTRSDLEYSEKFKYSFSFLNFTQGLDLPDACEKCEELGTTCKDCMDEKQLKISPLPRMTPEFLKIIDEALRKAYDENKLPHLVREKRIDFAVDLEKYVERRFPGAKLSVIGSSDNGFGFQNSDLDLCLTFENKSLESINVKQTLIELCRHLRKNDQYSNVFGLYSAKIPIVKFFHARTKIRGDISMHNILAVHNTWLLDTYSQIDERAKILGICMKLLAKNGCIADTAQKTLSSYSYILMVIHFLQQTNPPVLPVLQELYDKFEDMPRDIRNGWNVWFFNDLKKLKLHWNPPRNEQTVGELWLELLEYYTVNFQADKYVITIRQKEPLVRIQKDRSARLFNIEDPIIFKKNLGCVMSEKMASRTLKTLYRARRLFGTPLTQIPAGAKDFKEYLFNPMNLTGTFMKLLECTLCQTFGHDRHTCPKYSNSIKYKRPTNYLQYNSYRKNEYSVRKYKSGKC